MYIDSPVKERCERLRCRCINVPNAGPRFAYQEDSSLHFACRFAEEINDT
jgi:hypothetical protein